VVSDDIVTRLREGKGNDIDLFKMMDEGADEIERLRAERDGLQIRIYTLMKALDKAVRDAE